MSLLWCCRGVPGGFALSGISLSVSFYLVKQNDMKATHLKTRDGEYKEKDILKRKAKVWRNISMVYFYLYSTS